MMTNPFVRYSEKKLLFTGLFATIIGSVLAAHFYTRYDGVLDAHTVSELKYYMPFLDNVINVFCLSLVLYGIGKYINRKTRGVDILTVVLISRIPLYIFPLFQIGGYLDEITKKLLPAAGNAFELNITGIEMIFLLVFALVYFAALALFIVLLRYGFAVASNVKSVKHWVLFAFGILVAEILSKLIFLTLN
ncbi:hypothetical protein [Sinomicrobium weinanense]|uniref:Yip1 domain-containing protein n=1 Tax=Sinomicrobium weinanense TaxID=2842200 RepID=A0A926JS65_9FLAO|nr:hypothetical protein [Sinomicrobium weinanense]MBC9796236.1 hypothetical protein [Sinomicrobium weinanense]MBU3122309.1 hypothetical protein [Sinomicrobium weinanense]